LSSGPTRNAHSETAPEQTARALERFARDPPFALAVTLTADQLAVLANHVADLLRDSRDNGFLDVDAAASYLGGCSRTAVYHLVERGRIRAHRLGGRLLFDPAELRQDMEHSG
jgi:excisionase family DNA binding protein